jgi:predicted DNA-binding transcriptional regulator AlpA
MERAAERVERATTDIPAASAILGISKNYGFKLAAEGKFPGARRVGNRWVVSTKALLAFLDGTD